MNIPNLPLPGSSGWLLLIGSGEFSFGQTEEIDRFFLSKLTKKSIAFLPTASGSQEYGRHLGNYFRQLDPEVETINVPIYRGRDVRRGKNLDALREAGGIYLGGGVANTLIETLHGSPVVDELRAALERGAIVAAIGAAASSLGVLTRDVRRVGAPLRALGIVPGAVIETNAFDVSTNEMLKRLMSDPEAAIGFGIPPQTALAIGPDRSGTILGNGSIAVVRKPK